MRPIPDRPLDAAYELRTRAESGVSDAQILALWDRDNALDAQVVAERLGQVVFVATAVDSGEPVGVSTAVVQRSLRLGMDLWNLRTFVSEDSRRGYLALHLTGETTKLLERRWTDGVDRSAQGIMLEVENEALKVGKRGWFRSLAYMFIGENDRGDHLRINYFAGATVPLPPGVS